MTAASPWDTLWCVSLSSKLPMSGKQTETKGSGPAGSRQGALGAQHQSVGQGGNCLCPSPCHRMGLPLAPIPSRANVAVPSTSLAPQLPCLAPKVTGSSLSPAHGRAKLSFAAMPTLSFGHGSAAGVQRPQPDMLTSTASLSPGASRLRPSASIPRFMSLTVTGKALGQRPSLCPGLVQRPAHWGPVPRCHKEIAFWGDPQTAVNPLLPPHEQTGCFNRSGRGSCFEVVSSVPEDNPPVLHSACPLSTPWGEEGRAS